VSHEPPQVTKAIEDTAQAAIAAVNESHNKRRKEGAQPLYSKRRKKPRLSDCEDKLAALKAENEMLKRHVRNVTKKAQAFDQERQRATEEMKRMLQQGAPPEMINPVIAKFSEMYSDYGRHRHEELTFHLDQLEK
jgi:predicted RNase H-like nuclease (RuvC/YqgF family)